MDILLKKDHSVDSFQLISAVIAKSYNHGEKAEIPSELLNFRNVKGRVHKHKISLS